MRVTRLGIVIGLAACLVGGLAAHWALRPLSLAASALPNHQANLENGELLFYAGGCASCHAAPGAQGQDKLVLTGGLELHTEFGTFVVPNISSDPEFGIGGWAVIDFVNAMKQGVSPRGSHYYPSFPYGSYQIMPLTDLMDLYAYMKDLPASSEPSHDHQLAFPFSIRAGVGVWKWLYWSGDTFEPKADASPQINRGAYLVNGPGHCGECHTPRTLLGGMRRDRWLAGAPEAEGNGFVPNITPHQTGIGTWLEDDIVYALESGLDPEFDSFGGSMVAVQENMAQLPPSDLEAVAAYLVSLPALEETPRPDRK